MFVAPGPLLAATLPLLALAGCENLSQASGEAPPTIALHGVVLRHYTADGLAAIGLGQDVSFLRDSGQLGGRSLVVDLPPSERVGRGGVRVTAARGEGDVHGKAAHLIGGVRALSALGDDVRSEEATYQGAKDALFADTPLHAEGPGYVLDGNTWLAHVRARQLSLTDGARTQTRGDAP